MESLGFVVCAPNDDWIMYDSIFFSSDTHHTVEMRSFTAPYMCTDSSCFPFSYYNHDIAPLAAFLVALDAAEGTERQAVFERRGDCWATQAACADAVRAAGNKLDLTRKTLSTRDVTYLATALVDPQVICFSDFDRQDFSPLRGI